MDAEGGEKGAVLGGPSIEGMKRSKNCSQDEMGRRRW